METAISPHLARMRRERLCQLDQERSPSASQIHDHRMLGKFGKSDQRDYVVHSALLDESVGTPVRSIENRIDMLMSTLRKTATYERIVDICIDKSVLPGTPS